jgi:CubicO group peptidase (beta-lactamase class C family)
VADPAALETAIAGLFANQGRSGVPDTRALVVVQGGRVVVERYAPGFGRESRFGSWSMAKTFTQALVGILVRDGGIRIDDPVKEPAWRAPNDPRAALKIGHLLHMNTGLANSDGFGRGDIVTSFVSKMLFAEGSRDVVQYAASAKLEFEPGTHWDYSTATSMLLADQVAQRVGGGPDGVREFMRQELFEPLGITTAVPEFDASGNFLGGSYVWASALDFARFGLLYLRDGTWEDRRILPASWVDFSRTRAPAKNNGVYGAHLWLGGKPAEGQISAVPDLEVQSFAAAGAAGQYIWMIPAYDLIVVRLGELQATSYAELREQLSLLGNAFAPIRGGQP